MARTSVLAALILVLGWFAWSPGAHGASVGGRVVANPLAVTFGLDRPLVEQGVGFGGRAVVTNAATAPVLQVAVTLHADAALTATESSTQQLGNLGAQARAEAAWWLCATEPGNQIVVVSAAGTTSGGEAVSVESQAQLIEVTPGERTCGSYDFAGFYPPVDNPPTVNLATAGIVVPVKFSLGGDEGLDVLAPGYPATVGVACSSRTLTSSIEETAAAGSSVLSYDAATETYTYAWKTKRAWAGSCRELIVMLADGTVHRALFDFRP